MKKTWLEAEDRALDWVGSYEKAGTLGLFIFMYVTTVGFLIRLLIRDRSEWMKKVQQMTEIIVTNTKAWEKADQNYDKLITRVDREDESQRELITIIRAREQDGRHKK